MPMTKRLPFSNFFRAGKGGEKLLDLEIGHNVLIC
jgi:hypothetical protein